MDDIYSRITQKIISDLEKGELTWRKPWNSKNFTGQVMRPLRSNDIPYTGINTIVLWATAAERNYSSPYWMTYKQASEMKANVRKGEKGTQIVFANKITKEVIDADGQKTEEKIPFLKTYTVFNANQIDNLPDAFNKVAELQPKEQQRIETLETFFARTGVKLLTGTSAYYSPAQDIVVMPPFEAFHDAEGYYATLAHETVHWTGHPKRLSREFGRRGKTENLYAKEELVAELGACFLGADLGLEPATYEQHAAYIRSWLTVLQNDKRFIFQAASFAQKATEYLVSLQSAENAIQQPQPV